MRLTAGELRALWCLVPVLAAFLPPVTTWAAGVGTRVFGLPFLLFWSMFSAALTAAWMTLALYLKDRIDGKGDE